MMLHLTRNPLDLGDYAFLDPTRQHDAHEFFAGLTTMLKHINKHEIDSFEQVLPSLVAVMSSPLLPASWRDYHRELTFRQWKPCQERSHRSVVPDVDQKAVDMW
jgi:hypothetical protein